MHGRDVFAPHSSLSYYFKLKTISIRFFVEVSSD